MTSRYIFIIETSCNQFFQVEYLIIRSLVARFFFRTSIECGCIMSSITTFKQSFLISDTNIFSSQNIIIYSYIRRSNDGIFLILINCITFQSSLQSDQIRSVKFRLSSVRIKTKKLEVNSSCCGVSNRFANNLNQLTCSNCTSCFNNFCSAVDIAIVSICQLKACRIEMIASSRQSSCRELIALCWDAGIFIFHIHWRILQGSESYSFNTVNEQVGSKRDA